MLQNILDIGAWILVSSVAGLIGWYVQHRRIGALTAWAKANGGGFQPIDPPLLAEFADMHGQPFHEGRDPRNSGQTAKEIYRLTLRGHAVTVFAYTYKIPYYQQSSVGGNEGIPIVTGYWTTITRNWCVIAVEKPAGQSTLQLLNKDWAAQDPLITVRGMRQLPMSDPDLARSYHQIIGDNETLAHDILQIPAVRTLLARSRGVPVRFEGRYALSWYAWRPRLYLVKRISSLLTDLLTEIPPSVWHTPHPNPPVHHHIAHD